jgi:hypothetical protein
MKITTDDSNVTKLPVKKKETGASIQLVDRWLTKCKHAHVQVDRKLAELTCLDCKERLNPIEYIAWVAEGLVGWEHERQRIIEARKQYAERKQCRCTNCGEITEIRRVSDREQQLIRERHSQRTGASQ